MTRLRAAFEAEDVVVGGGNAKLIDKWPDGVRAGGNAQAIRGGYRLWQNQ